MTDTGTPDIPQRRRTDRGWRMLVRENAYRDVWLLIITFFVLVAVIKVGGKADTASVQAQSAKSVAAAIQRERARTIRENCEQQNARHNEVFAVVRQLLQRPAIPPRKLTAKQKQAQVDATFRFVDALVPMKDCAVLVKRQAPPHKQ